MKTRSLSILITLSILTVFSIVAYYLAFSYVKGINDKISTASANLAYTQAKYDRAMSLIAAEKNGKDNGKKLDKYILTQGDEISVIKSLERLALNLFLKSTTDTIETIEDEALSAQNKSFLHIVMTTTGSLQQTKRFQALVESLPYNVKMNRVDLYGGEGGVYGEWQGKFDFSIVEEKTKAITE